MRMLHGFAYAHDFCDCDHNFDLHEGWGVRQSYATLTRLELPKIWFNCLRGRLGHVDRNAYAWTYAMHHLPRPK